MIDGGVWMPVVKWIHFSDLHLNSDGMETELMRDELPKFLLKQGIRCDYAFCTGDIRFAPDGGYPDYSAEYIKSVCTAVHVATDSLFVVPGNHDVNKDSVGRADVVRKLHSKEYDSQIGKISTDDLNTIHAGKEDFCNILEKLYGKDSERMSYYRNGSKPHFIIETDYFNILHVDSTISYTTGEYEDKLILGTQELYRTLKQLNSNKPTILITHYAILSLSQDERKSVSELLQKFNVRLWLAGHEHEHNLTPYKTIYSIQAGQLRLEEKTNATVLVGEYDTDSGEGFVKAYSWFREGWAEYPLIWHGFNDEYNQENMFPFALGLPGNSDRSREAHLCKVANEQHLENPILRELLPDIQLSNVRYTGDNSLTELLRKLWQDKQKHVLILADGGMGKTTLLLDAARVKSQDPILYLSLEWLEAQDLTIEEYVCRILFQTERARDRLFQFTNSYKIHPDLILLLDGFNELSEVYEAKFGKEIRGLAQYPGMQIIVTSREDFTGRYNLRFQKALLCELVDDQIQKVLTQQEWIHIQGQYTLHQLLKNPMLLLMYKQVCPVMDRHQDAFLEWMDPIENATQLLHNYFVAQEAVLLERGEISGEYLIKAKRCVSYALPYIGFYYESGNHMSLHQSEFERILDKAVEFANKCDFSKNAEMTLRRRYRVRNLPEIDIFDIEDYLIKVMHLLHENNESFISFPHQMYRDYLSAQWLSAMFQSDIESMWNERRIPGYLHGYLREINDEYWNGIAVKLADFARNREADEIENLLVNVLDVFPYTEKSAVPNFRNIDFTKVRLHDYSITGCQIPMEGAKISEISLALQKKVVSNYQCLGFSSDNDWLVGATNHFLKIWSMSTGTTSFIYTFPEKMNWKTFCFSENGQYLFAVFHIQGSKGIAIFIQRGDEWNYSGTINDVGLKKLHSIIIANNSMYFYYNNRVKRYNLSDGRLLENRAQQHAWENPVLGTDIFTELFKNFSAKTIGHSLDGSMLESVSENKEFSAYAYNDGSLIVFRQDELYHILERGVARLKAAAISGDGKRAVTLSQQTFDYSRRVQLWDLEIKHRVGECFVSQDILNIHLSEHGEWIVGERKDSYHVWKWKDADICYDLNGKLISNQRGKITSRGNKVLYKNEKDMLEVLDLDNRKISFVENLCKDVRIADFLPNGELIIVGKNAKKAILHSTRDGREMSINSEPASVTGIYCMKTQPFVGLATNNQMLCFYHTGTGQRTRILKTTSGNKIIVGHPTKDVVACSGGRKKFETFNYFSFKMNNGRNAGKWYQNPIDHRFFGDVLDMDFNESNGELVTIMSDGAIVYSHDMYCRYHSSTQIITNFSVDSYDFTGVICDDEIRENLLNNGASI